MNESVAAPEGVDFDVLGAWMDDQRLPGGEFSALSRLSGGTQNVLVRFRRGGREFVLRRGPLHLRPTSNDALRREATVLAALEGTDVPHPALIAACFDEHVMGGAVFYLMEPVEGFNPTVELPALYASDPSIRHEMGLCAIDALARLGALDHVALGLESLGHPDGFLERQVDRWRTELASYLRFDGYSGHSLPAVDDVAEWLEQHRPSRWTPGIMHGDYHLANLIYAFDGPRVAAVVDWEMCTIGDPLLDLGWLLATWPDPDGGGIGMPMPPGAAEGLATGDELIARYADQSSRDLAAVDWYRVMACFKLGIILEGSNARAHAGKAPQDVGDLLHSLAVGLFARAQGMIES